MDAIRSDPNVKVVERKFWMEWAAGGMTMVNPMNMTQPSLLEHRDVDMGTGWALSYLSATQKYPSHEEYHFLRGGGTGVDVYVVDTGVNPDRWRVHRRHDSRLHHVRRSYADRQSRSWNSGCEHRGQSEIWRRQKRNHPIHEVWPQRQPGLLVCQHRAVS